MGGPVRGRLLIWGDAMCLRARIRSFKPPQLHFLPFYHNLEVDKDCLVTQFCLFCIVTSLKILASYTLLPLLMYSCKFQLRNSIFIILYTITCALNDQSCRCAIKQHSFIHSFLHVIKYITSVEMQERSCFILCIHDIVLLVKQSDSLMVKQCVQRHLLHLVTLYETADLFNLE